MSAPEGADRAPLQRARERAATALSEAFSADELSLEEFEQRVDQCYRVSTVRELESLFEDLPVSPRLPGPGQAQDASPASRPGGAPGSAGGMVLRGERKARDLVVGVMSGVGRKGAWTPARDTWAVAVMGGVELDFRTARFPTGETTVNVLAVMGGVEIVVPPGLRVECSGLPLMGGFDRLDQDGDGSHVPGAVLRIRGLALMGGVEVRVASPGEHVPSRRSR